MAGECRPFDQAWLNPFGKIRCAHVPKSLGVVRPPCMNLDVGRMQMLMWTPNKGRMQKRIHGIHMECRQHYLCRRGLEIRPPFRDARRSKGCTVSIIYLRGHLTVNNPTPPHPTTVTPLPGGRYTFPSITVTDRGPSSPGPRPVLTSAYTVEVPR
jgi:hypothetical protein